jgi:hypothetical protein
MPPQTGQGAIVALARKAIDSPHFSHCRVPGPVISPLRYSLGLHLRRRRFERQQLQPRLIHAALKEFQHAIFEQLQIKPQPGA